MRHLLRKAFKAYKYLSLLYAIVYWPYIVIDDYVLIEKYWKGHWPEYLGVWGLYFLIFFVTFSIYYWVISIAVVAVYHYIRQRTASKRVT